MTYYAVSNVNGPISKRLYAETEAAALAEFEAADTQKWIDEPATDAEDDLDIPGDGITEDAFEAALEAAGAVRVCDLSPIHNYHAGTTAHLADGWMLWAVD